MGCITKHSSRPSLACLLSILFPAMSLLCWVGRPRNFVVRSKNKMRIIDLLNNSSIAAFFGALSAFFLVVVNDYRRDRKRLRIIRNEIKVVSDQAKNKAETVKRNRSAIQDHNKIIIAPILKFNPSIIRQLSTQVLDKFTQEQRLAIEAICYTMETIDGLLDSVLKKAQHISEINGIERNQLCDQLIIYYNDVIVNLNRLKEMSNNFSSGKYKIIVTKQYVRSEYEE